MLEKDNIKFLSTIFIVFGVSMALYALYTEVKMLKEDVKYLKRNRQDFEDCEVECDHEDEEDDEDEQMTEQELQEMMQEHEIPQEYWGNAHFHPEDRYTINMMPIQELEEPEETKPIEVEAKSMVSENVSLFEMLEKEHSESPEDNFTILAEDIKKNQENEHKKHSKRGRKPKSISEEIVE